MILKDGDLDVMSLEMSLFISWTKASCSVSLQSETKLYNGSDKDVSASGGKLTKKESLKVSELKAA